MARRSVRLSVRMECGDLPPAVDLSVKYLARFGSSNGFSACTLAKTSNTPASVSLSVDLQLASGMCWKSDRLSPEQARFGAILSEAN